MWLLLVVLSAVPAQAKTIHLSAEKSYTKMRDDQSMTTLEGSARVELDGLTITADRIELSGKDYRYMYATGSVSGEDVKKGMTFSTNNLKFDRETERVEFFGESSIVDTKNDAHISADYIVYNQKNNTVLLQIDVAITQKNITTSSMFAFYRRDNATLDLTGRPVVKKSEDEFKALRIFVNLDTEEIRLEGRVSGSIIEKTEEPEKNESTEDPSEKSVLETVQKTTAHPDTEKKPKTEATPSGEPSEPKDKNNE